MGIIENKKAKNAFENLLSRQNYLVTQANMAMMRLNRIVKVGHKKWKSRQKSKNEKRDWIAGTESV